MAIFHLLLGNSRRNIFRILFWCLAWSSNLGFLSNKATHHYLLDHGDIYVSRLLPSFQAIRQNGLCSKTTKCQWREAYCLKSTPNEFYFALQSFCQKSSERKSPKKYFSYFILMSLVWHSNPGFLSNKATHYLVEYGDFLHTIKLSLYPELGDCFSFFLLAITTLLTPLMLCVC